MCYVTGTWTHSLYVNEQIQTIPLLANRQVRHQGVCVLGASQGALHGLRYLSSGVEGLAVTQILINDLVACGGWCWGPLQALCGSGSLPDPGSLFGSVECQMGERMWNPAPRNSIKVY